MRIAVIGAGPAGLYFSYLIKRRRPDIDISVFEQNPPDATFGFGVVFSDRALEFLRGDDPETYDLVTPRMETWTDMQLDIEGTTIRIDGIGFSAIGRLDLLRLLQQQARAAGVELLFETKIDETADLAAVDLVVAADGAGSMTRTARQDAFATGVETLSNKFVWYGTDKPFDTLTQTFRRNADGVFNAHHYRYTPDMSTFIVETDAASWARAGFAAMDEEATRAWCEAVFADTLEGHRLISNKSVWRDYLKISNEIWSAGNTVLVGDALRTAHFSIGSGTRLAMEDAIALDRALDRALDKGEGDIPAALADYQATRRPVVDKLVAAADASALWYERFGEHMALDPWDMAWSYIQRSGRISAERLAKISPVFVARYQAEHGQ
jgi:2-polyprenyl-6-methoxyphenol hydroxylase-like FAD-dependent oxidoreductase